MQEEKNRLMVLWSRVPAYFRLDLKLARGELLALVNHRPRNHELWSYRQKGQGVLDKDSCSVLLNLISRNGKKRGKYWWQDQMLQTQKYVYPYGYFSIS